ncbi:MAG: YdcF family protein [Ignavibacteria bacterium]|nr:YdcF family protein [Ignavibacteria bacterium]
MKRKRPGNSSNTGIILAGLFALLYFIFLIYLKYDLNDIPLKEIRFDYIGNVMNGIVTVILIIALVVIRFLNRSLDSKKVLFINTLMMLSLALLLAVWMLAKLNFLHTDKMIFNFPLKKVYMGAAYVISLFIQVYSLNYLWGWIIGNDSLLELRTAIRTIVAIVVLMVFSLVFVWNVRAFSQSRIENQTFTYGCIPGAAVYSKGNPSPIFEKRIRKALELYQKGSIKKVILTGGRAPGEMTEAEAAKKYLINLGVAKKNIVIENRSSTTTEQIQYLRKNFGNETTRDSVLIISDGFHLSRITQIAKFYRVNSLGVSSDYSLSFEKTIFYRTRESIALLLFWFFAI